MTIKDVAADADVSVQTVSRVINNERYVHASKAERVRASIEKLGYVPSIAARRMGGSRSFLLLALNDRERTIADWRDGVGSDWVGQMLLGGMLRADEHGYRLMFELVDTHSDRIEPALLAILAAVSPDGVILTPPHSANEALIRLLAERDIPFARIGVTTPGPGHALAMDDRGAAAAATRHLQALGHERIAFVTGPAEYQLSEERLAGWRGTMDAAELPCEGLLENGDFGFSSGRQAAERLLGGDRPPTAIVASSEQMALAALEVARERGINVPGDLSIISFDDTPIIRFTQPPLTAIRQPIAELTARAVDLLVGARAESQQAEPVILPGTLKIRESTALPPTRG